MRIRAHVLRTTLCACAMLAGLGVQAQTDAPAPAGANNAGPETQLHGVEDTLRESEEQRKRIETEIESLRADRARLNEALIETTANVQNSERQLAAATAQMAMLNGNVDALTRSLDGRREVIADVLGVLQRMGRNPPPAILVRPHDMAEAIRAAIVLGSVIPDLKLETEALARDLEDLTSLRATVDRQREVIAARSASLAQDRDRLSALVEARQSALASAEGALGSERARAAELAQQATNLKDLIGKMEADARAARAGAAAAQATAAEIAAKAEMTRGGDPAHLKPALAFAEARGLLPLPVAGSILKAFGAPDAFGGAEKGVSIATPPAATVAAPADGSIVFSGPYRTYGQLLIINAGGGYYMVLAGMNRINVSVGQFVLAGEPVGAMGDGSARMAPAAAIGAAQPILYIELRKDGAAIDPGPWWAKADIEKARG